MATNKEMMLHNQMTPVVELQASAADIDAVARAYKNGQLGGVHLPDGETLMVESAQRETYGLTTGTADFSERRMSGVVFTAMGRGEHDAVRLDSVGVKTAGAGSVRFVLYELARNEGGTTGTLKPVETLGEVVMEADGVARLDFDGGCYTDLAEFVVLALSDRSMLCAMAMNGITISNWLGIQDADYYTGGNTEISCTIGEGSDVVWLSWLVDYSLLDYMTIEDFARHISLRMADAEGWIETLKERKALPSTYLVPDGYVPTTKDGEVVWAAQTGGSGDSGLPDVTEADNGKIVGVVNGGYGLITMESADSGSSTEIDILPKQTLEFAYNSDVGCHAVQLSPSPVTLEYGTDYYVEWDGEVFLSTTCNEGEMIFDGAPVVGMGNAGLLGGASDGQPYAIGYIPAADLLVIMTADDSATHTIRIYQKVAASALETPTAVDLTQYESNGVIVETYADGSTKTTTMEFDADGNPIKITDGDGNVTVLTW